MTKISDYTADAASDPIKNEDLVDMSNEDGGGGFDVSKKITVAELLAFLGSIGAIAQDIVVTGTGTGAGASEFKIGDIGGDGVYMGVDGFFAASTYNFYIDKTSAELWLNSVGEMNFTVDDGQRTLALTDGVVKLALGTSAHTVLIGNNVTGTGAKLQVRGETNDNTKEALLVTDLVQSKILQILCDGLLSLKNGTGINEFSIDGTLAGDSDDAVPTEKAVKTYVDGLLAPQIIGGVTLSSSSATNILNGTYVILADTTTVTSVASGIGQDSNWTLEITQPGITNQKGVVTFTGNLQKDGGAGNKLYDIALFKNGSIISESEQEGQKLENGTKGQSVTVMAITEFSTSDTFDIRVSGNGTAEDIFCGGGSIYIQ